VPDGLAFSEFKGYETWQVASISLSGDLMAVVLVNPTMVAAYKAGIPGNGNRFPTARRWRRSIGTRKERGGPEPHDGAGHAARRRLHGARQQALREDRQLGYAQFNYDGAADAFTPLGSGSECGFACHTIVKTKDYVFTTFPKR
jgi:hypothetical protein